MSRWKVTINYGTFAESIEEGNLTRTEAEKKVTNAAKFLSERLKMAVKWEDRSRTSFTATRKVGETYHTASGKLERQHHAPDT